MRRGLSLLCLLSGAAAAQPAPFRWGADGQGGAPYVFQDPMDPNRLVGFEVELADLLAQRLGTKAQLVAGPWDKLLELLARGDFDAALNGIEVAEEKKRVALLSRPYFAAPEVLTVRRGDPSAPRSLAELKGRKLGTLPGAMAERIAARAGADVRTYDGGQDEIYDDLKAGRIDAVLLDEPIAHYYGDVEPTLESIHGNFGVVQYAVAVRLDDAQRLEVINQRLDELIADGSLRRLYERWGVWSNETAVLFGDTNLEAETAPTEFERWRAAVQQLPPFWVRVKERYPAMLPLFLRGAVMTVVVSTLAMALAVLLGMLLAVMRLYAPRPLKALAVGYIEFFRGTPLLIQLTMVYFGLPEVGVRLDPLTAGVVALGLNYAAAEAENYRAGLSSVPGQQSEAAAVLGLSTWGTLRFVTGPQAVRTSLPPMTNDFIALIKDSSLVSLVTLTELTKTYTNLATSTRDHLGLGVVVALIYLLLGLPIARLARRAEKRFSKHLARGRA